MFTIVEIDKTGPLLGALTNLAPYVYASIISIAPASPYSIAPYWTTIFGADGTYNATDKNVTGVTLNTIFDVEEVDTHRPQDAGKQLPFDYDKPSAVHPLPHFWTPEVVNV